MGSGRSSSLALDSPVPEEGSNHSASGRSAWTEAATRAAAPAGASGRLLPGSSHGGTARQVIAKKGEGCGGWGWGIETCTRPNVRCRAHRIAQPYANLLHLLTAPTPPPPLSSPALERCALGPGGLRTEVRVSAHWLLMPAAPPAARGPSEMEHDLVWPLRAERERRRHGPQEAVPPRNPHRVAPP